MSGKDSCSSECKFEYLTDGHFKLKEKDCWI